MKTITKIINLYSFSELPENIKQKILSNYRTDDYYPSQDDNNSTLKAFQYIFPVTIKNYDYGYRNYINFSFNLDIEIENLSGLRLRTYIINNYDWYLFKPKYLSHIKGKPVYSKINFSDSCTLTGYYLDNEILQPIYYFLLSPDSTICFHDIMHSCLHAWIAACDNDYQNWNSDEYITEEINDNEYLFTIDGTIYHD